MALPPSGLPDYPIELLTIKTNEITLTLSGLPIHPTVGQLQLLSNDKALLEIKAYDGFEAKIFDPASNKEDYLVSYSEPYVFPFLYENQNYTLTIQAKNSEDKIQFYHENKRLRESIRPVKQIKGLLNGNLNFKNEVGFTEFEIWNHDMRILTVTLEVFPSKMDYRNDYVKLLNEVNEIIYNLAYDFLKKTFIHVGFKETDSPSEVEFFAIIQSIMDQLVYAVDRIESYPHYRHMKESTVRNIHQVKKVTVKSQKWLRKNQNLFKEDGAGPLFVVNKRYIPEKLVESKKIKSFDTDENRFLKWVLQQLGFRLKSFKKQYMQALQNRLDEQFINKIDRLLNQTQRMLKKDFLKEVSNLSRISISLVLQLAPGYREVYKFFLMLKKGLAIQSDLYKISPKEISTLYEYWCFLKIHQIMQKKYELINNDTIKVNNKGIFVTLEKNKSGKMTYRNPVNGEKYQLYYNPSYSNQSYTTGQKPDHVLTLHKKGMNQQFKFVFDTKYRINPAIPGTPYHDLYQTPGPLEDDINTMHRYRDALIFEDKHTKKIMRDSYGAYVLFPYHNEDEYKSHQFYKSIEQVNIGGLPFLPNHTKLVEELLFDLIEEDSESSFHRNLLPHTTENFYSKKTYDMNVLIGTVKNVVQYNAIIKYHFYHIQLQAVKNRLSQLKYIALYQQVDLGLKNNGIILYGKIKDFRIVQRKEIKELPKNSNEYYVYFEVESWEELDHVIKPVGYGVRWFMITNIELLKSALQLPELTLKNDFELRLWRELRRYSKSFKFASKEKWIDQQTDTVIQLKDHEEIRLSLNRDELVIYIADETISFTKEQIKYEPKTVIEKVRKILTNHL